MLRSSSTSDNINISSSPRQTIHSPESIELPSNTDPSIIANNELLLKDKDGDESRDNDLQVVGPISENVEGKFFLRLACFRYIDLLKVFNVFLWNT